MRKRWTASTALFFLVLCTVCVSVFILAYGVKQDWEYSKEVAVNKTLSLAKACAERQKTFTANTEVLLRTLVNVPIIVQGNPERVSAFLRKLDVDQPDYVGFSVFRPDGSAIAATIAGKDAPTLVPDTIRSREYFTLALERSGLSIGEFLPAPGSPHIPSLPMATPILDEKGTVVAVAMAAIDFRRYDALITNLIGKTADSVQIFDRRRVLMYYNQSHNAEILGASVRDPHIAKLMDSTKAVSWSIYTAENGSTEITAMVKLYVTPEATPYMYIYVTSPLPTAWDFVSTRYMIELLSMLLLLLVALILAHVMGNYYFSKGLEKLAIVAESAEQGNYAIRSGNIVGCREILVLATAFDSMLDALERNTALLQHERACLDFALEGGQMGTWEWDPQHDFCSMDNRSMQLLGYKTHDLENRDPRDLMHPDDVITSQTNMRLHMEGTLPYYNAELRLKHREGRWLWASLQGRLEVGRSALEGPRVFGIFMDVTQRKRIEELEQEKAEHYRHLSNTDALTNLSNRRHFMEQALEGMQRASRYAHVVTVVMADIDFFKKINDTYGHAVGDVVLQAFANILRTSTRNTDLVGRYGGEEFIFFLAETSLPEATATMEKIRHHLEKTSFPVDGNLISFTVSFGLCACVPTPFIEQGHQRDLGVLLNALIACADACLYRAKAEGRNRVVFQEGLLAPDTVVEE